MRRVVVTGLGVVSPLGNDLISAWQNACRGVSGINVPTLFPPDELGVYACAQCRDFEDNEFVPPRAAKRLDRFGVFNLIAASQAVEDAGLLDKGYDLNKIAVVSGVAVGGIYSLIDHIDRAREKGYKNVSPLAIPKTITNLAPAAISIKYGFCGPSYAVNTACASGGDAIGSAYELIKYGKAVAAVAGGAEAVIQPHAVAGFAKMQALSTNPDYKTASRPFDKDRDGFVFGEGAAYLILEDMESAVNRGAKIYCEIAGYGQTCDAYHITAPHPECRGAVDAMSLAVEESGLAVTEIDYINAHATSTPLNDINETKAIKTLFGDHAKDLCISGTKSMTGHLLGAAGAIEALFTVMSVYEDFALPTVATKNLDPECDLDYVLDNGRKKKINAALSNSFGFGGQNAVLLFKKV